MVVLGPIVESSGPIYRPNMPIRQNVWTNLLANRSQSVKNKNKCKDIPACREEDQGWININCVFPSNIIGVSIYSNHKIPMQIRKNTGCPFCISTITYDSRAFIIVPEDRLVLMLVYRAKTRFLVARKCLARVR